MNLLNYFLKAKVSPRPSHYIKISILENYILSMPNFFGLKIVLKIRPTYDYIWLFPTTQKGRGLYSSKYQSFEC